MADIGGKVPKMAKITLLIEVSKVWRSAIRKRCLIYSSAFTGQMQYILGIYSRKLRYKTWGIKNVHISFYNVQFLHVQRHWFIGINYINALLSLYDSYTYMLLLNLNEIICKRKYRFIPIFNESTSRLYLKIWCCVLAVCPASYIEMAAFKKIRNIRRLYFYILTSNHAAISQSMAIAIFTIFLAQMRTKPTLGRVQRNCVSSVIRRITKNYCWGRNLPWYTGTTIIIASLAAVSMLVRTFFVLYNNYLISCGCMCTFSYKMM